MITNYTRKPSVAIDMYNMIGYCSSKTIKEQLRFALRNLADASDMEVIQMQEDLINFMSKEVVRMPAGGGHGIILNSGSEANEIGILMAREATKKKIVIASNLCHASIDNTCKKLGLKLVKIDVDENTFKVRAAQLTEVINKHHANIALINVTYGTTKLGSGEDVEYTKELEMLVRKHNIRIHIDAAYGGMILSLLDKLDNNNPWKQSKGFESMTVDTHKFVGILGCGLLLLADDSGKDHLGKDPIYFEGNYSSLGTTRSALALATALATSKDLGISGLRSLAEKAHKDAVAVGEKIKNMDGTLVYTIESGVVPIRLKNEKQVREIIVSLNKLGFKVSPIIIQFKKSTIYGIRIVVTPNQDRCKTNLMRFLDCLEGIRLT